MISSSYKKIIKKYKKLLHNRANFSQKEIHNLCKCEPGSINWLIGKEMHYGGFHTNIPRYKVSPLDPRSTEEVQTGGMTGGDRMFHHGYAKTYEKFLYPYINKSKKITLIEVGILKGTGLALWCDLFKKSTIIGLDIDLNNFQNNIEKLKSLNAFEHNELLVYEFDQFVDNKQFFEKNLNGNTVDIFIDDGIHDDNAIITTFNSAYSFLSDDFLYIIEDNKTARSKIEKTFNGLSIWINNEITVIKRST